MGETVDSSPSVRQVSSGVIWNFVAYFIRMVIAIVVSAIIVRTLGKALYGTYSLVFHILSYATLICQFNFNTALLRYVPEYKRFNDATGLKKFINKLLSMQVSIWLAFLLLFYLTGESLEKFYKIELGTYLFIGMLSLIITVSNQLLESALTAFYEIRIQAVLSISSGFFHILLLYFFLTIYNLDIVGCFLAIILKDLVVLTGYSRKLSQLLAKYKGKTQAATAINNKRLFNFALPSLFNNLVNCLVLSQSETLYLGYFSTPADVGIYNVGYIFPQRFITVIPTVLRNITNVALTDFYLKDSVYLKNLTELYYKLLFLFIAPFSVGGALLVDRVVVMIYGADMEIAGVIAQVLFIVHTFILFSNPYTFIMRTLEHMWIGFRISIISAIVSISLNLLLISQYGLKGAVVSTSVTLLLNGLLRFIIYQRHYPFVKIPWKSIGKCYLSTVCFLTVLPFKHLISTPLYLAGAIVYMFGCWIATVKILKIIDEDGLRLLYSFPIPYMKKIADFLYNG